jgi:predicted dehydrogenase
MQVEYPQDWLTVEETTKQADWRTDPARSGLGGSTGDIGTHAFNLACFVTGLERAESLCADLDSPSSKAVSSMTTATCMLRFDGGAAACSGAPRSRRATRTP